MAKNPYRAPFFSGNIVIIIHKSPLIKMVPLMESSGGALEPIQAHGHTCVIYKLRCE